MIKYIPKPKRFMHRNTCCRPIDNYNLVIEFEVRFCLALCGTLDAESLQVLWPCKLTNRPWCICQTEMCINGVC